MLAAACGVAHQPAASSTPARPASSTPATTSSSTTETVAASPQPSCPAAELRAHIAAWLGPIGSNMVVIEVTNTGSVHCRVGGFASVEMHEGGHWSPIHADNAGGPMGATRPVPARFGPGHPVFFTVDLPLPLPGPGCRQADAARLELRGARGWVTIAHFRDLICPGGDVVTPLDGTDPFPLASRG
ncbi:MAG: DUF4232 domain-containing protein [Actinomycetota bacterium]|nr:DUF4232 domain-containing protein [Actinomycetota bacterium]